MAKKILQSGASVHTQLTNSRILLAISLVLKGAVLQAKRQSIMPLKQWGRPVRIVIQTRALARWKRHLEKGAGGEGMREGAAIKRD